MIIPRASHPKRPRLYRKRKETWNDQCVPALGPSKHLLGCHEEIVMGRTKLGIVLLQLGCEAATVKRRSCHARTLGRTHPRTLQGMSLALSRDQSHRLVVSKERAAHSSAVGTVQRHIELNGRWKMLEQKQPCAVGPQTAG